MRAPIVVVGVLAFAGCPHPPVKEKTQFADPVAMFDGDPTQAMKAELADQILASYARDEPPDVETAMIAPEIGPARIGVGPGDVLITADDFARVPSRWPLFLGREAKIDVRSKRLHIDFARDRSAAYTSDELSWRIPACGRIAVIPMRITALYAHDGDRWVQVFEHMSFGRTPVVDLEGLVGKPIKTASSDRDLSDELSRGVARNPGFVTDDATLIGPGVGDAWQGPGANAQLPATLISEDRRVGTVGRLTAAATIAYWVGNFTIDVPARGRAAAGKVRVRGTFVFEKRKREAEVTAPAAHPVAASITTRAEAVMKAINPCINDGKGCRWTLVQAHVSQAIRDLDLASTVFGVSLATPYVPEQPLSVTCD